mgnify:FL=1
MNKLNQLSDTGFQKTASYLQNNTVGNLHFFEVFRTILSEVVVLKNCNSRSSIIQMLFQKQPPYYLQKKWNTYICSNVMLVCTQDLRRATFDTFQAFAEMLREAVNHFFSFSDILMEDGSDTGEFSFLFQDFFPLLCSFMEQGIRFEEYVSIEVFLAIFKLDVRNPQQATVLWDWFEKLWDSQTSETRSKIVLFVLNSFFWASSPSCQLVFPEMAPARAALSAVEKLESENDTGLWAALSAFMLDFVPEIFKAADVVSGIFEVLRKTALVSKHFGEETAVRFSRCFARFFLVDQALGFHEATFSTQTSQTMLFVLREISCPSTLVTECQSHWVQRVRSFEKVDPETAARISRVFEASGKLTLDKEKMSMINLRYLEWVTCEDSLKDLFSPLLVPNSPLRCSPVFVTSCLQIPRSMLQNFKEMLKSSLHSFNVLGFPGRLLTVLLRALSSECVTSSEKVLEFVYAVLYHTNFFELDQSWATALQAGGGTPEPLRRSALLMVTAVMDSSIITCPAEKWRALKMFFFAYATLEESFRNTLVSCSPAARAVVAKLFNEAYDLRFFWGPLISARDTLVDTVAASVTGKPFRITSLSQAHALVSLFLSGLLGEDVFRSFTRTYLPPKPPEQELKHLSPQGLGFSDPPLDTAQMCFSMAAEKCLEIFPCCGGVVQEFQARVSSTFLKYSTVHQKLKSLVEFFLSSRDLDRFQLAATGVEDLLSSGLELAWFSEQGRAGSSSGPALLCRIRSHLHISNTFKIFRALLNLQFYTCSSINLGLGSKLLENTFNIVQSLLTETKTRLTYVWSFYSPLMASCLSVTPGTAQHAQGPFQIQIANKSGSKGVYDQLGQEKYRTCVQNVWKSVLRIQNHPVLTCEDLFWTSIVSFLVGDCDAETWAFSFMTLDPLEPVF